MQIEVLIKNHIFVFYFKEMNKMRPTAMNSFTMN